MMYSRIGCIRDDKYPQINIQIQSNPSKNSAVCVCVCVCPCMLVRIYVLYVNSQTNSKIYIKMQRAKNSQDMLGKKLKEKKNKM